MVDLVYLQNGRGKSGHCLQDLFSSVNLACALGVQAVYHPCWDRQSILPVDGIRETLGRFKAYEQKLDYAVAEALWEGIDSAEFNRIRQFIDLLDASGRKSLLCINSVYRLHLGQVYTLEQAGFAPSGSFHRALSMLRRMFWGREFPRHNGEIETIAVHVRRGDIMLPNSNHKYRVWDTNFYREVIDDLKFHYPNAHIKLFTQKRRSKDVDSLTDVEVRHGGPSQSTDDFREMVQADLFVPSNSCYSYWLAYLSRGTVRFYGGVDFLDPSLPVENFETASVSVEVPPPKVCPP